MRITEIAEGGYKIRPKIRPFVNEVCAALGITRQPTVYEALRGDNYGNGKYFDIRLWCLKNIPCEVIEEKKIKIEY